MAINEDNDEVIDNFSSDDETQNIDEGTLDEKKSTIVLSSSNFQDNLRLIKTKNKNMNCSLNSFKKWSKGDKKIRVLKSSLIRKDNAKDEDKRKKNNKKENELYSNQISLGKEKVKRQSTTPKSAVKTINVNQIQNSYTVINNQQNLIKIENHIERIRDDDRKFFSGSKCSSSYSPQNRKTGQSEENKSRNPQERFSRVEEENCMIQ